MIALTLFIEGRIIQLVYLVIMVVIISYFLNTIKKENLPKIRQIPALDAIPEIVGRATETGRPVHFTLGWTRPEGLRGGNAATILAGLSVLSHLSNIVAEMGAELIVTLGSPDIIPVATEIIQDGYAAAGYMEAFNPDQILFFGTEQFAYISGVLGVIGRENIGSNVMVGPFAGEALMFAEAAAREGAMQLAGTQSVYQTPFFIACCDYFLIGEEVYAAGAYLSKEPRQLGSIRGQDASKILSLITLIIGSLLSILGNNFVLNLLNM